MIVTAELALAISDEEIGRVSQITVLRERYGQAGMSLLLPAERFTVMRQTWLILIKMQGKCMMNIKLAKCMFKELTV